MSTSTFTDEEFFESENDLLGIFGLEAADAPRAEDTELTPAHGERIDNIVTEALHEAVVKDTTTFFFKTFGVGLSGLASAVFASLSDLSNDGETDQNGERSEIDLGGQPPDDG